MKKTANMMVSAVLMIGGAAAFWSPEAKARSKNGGLEYLCIKNAGGGMLVKAQFGVRLADNPANEKYYHTRKSSAFPVGKTKCFHVKDRFPDRSMVFPIAEIVGLVNSGYKKNKDCHRHMFYPSIKKRAFPNAKKLVWYVKGYPDGISCMYGGTPHYID